MIKPKSFDGPIPHEVRYRYNDRTYWVAYFGQGLWSVEPDDDSAALIRCNGKWIDAIQEFERR